MSFKHGKFDDSSVMKSLEKLAQEKGLIKSDPIKKKSEKKKNLSPSENLMENIVKLCSGLREAGMEKYADELESAYIIYKESGNLYETSKEKGEDLVHDAHPKGSHKLEGVSGDAIVETILDQRLKILDVIGKMPKGKLSNASEIIGAVNGALSKKAQQDENTNIKRQRLAFVITKNVVIQVNNIITSAITMISNNSAKSDIDNENKKMITISNNIGNEPTNINMSKLNEIDECIKNMLKYFGKIPLADLIWYSVPVWGALKMNYNIYKRTRVLDMGSARKTIIISLDEEINKIERARQALRGSLDDNADVYADAIISDVIARSINDHVVKELEKCILNLSSMRYDEKMVKFRQNTNLFTQETGLRERAEKVLAYGEYIKKQYSSSKKLLENVKKVILFGFDKKDFNPSLSTKVPEDMSDLKLSGISGADTNQAIINLNNKLIQFVNPMREASKIGGNLNQWLDAI